MIRAFGAHCQDRTHAVQQKLYGYSRALPLLTSNGANIMKSVDDIKIAEDALATLKRLRGRTSNVPAVLKELESLSYKVNPTHPDQGDQRHDAWIAVQKLRRELTRDPNCPDGDVLWKDATAKMNVWRKWL
jgi:hypothetical protein